MLNDNATRGAIAGALLAIIWVTLDGGAALLVAALATTGWLVGTILDRPDVLIEWLQRLQDR